jgi:ribosomal protein S1
MLIDESERTFKRGVIVTATVTRVLEDKVICKLENGLEGLIRKDDIIGPSIT